MALPVTPEERLTRVENVLKRLMRERRASLLEKARLVEAYAALQPSTEVQASARAAVQEALMEASTIAVEWDITSP